MERVGHVAGMVKEPSPEVRRAAGMSRREWCYNIKINLNVTGCEGVDWIHLA
jgi:hypothetical protein